jgi:ribosome-associated toxin RatA of RatAB toxin-antitoxin module
MAEHNASVTVNAPVHQVYQLFSHFNDYPKFMSHIKEVTYYDDQRSHWVADVVGKHEWDAVNEGWVEDQQIGWRSTEGLKNSGAVRFSPAGSNQTRLVVTINYDPPAGVLGAIGEALGVGKSLEAALQRDLDNFAAMVAGAPPGALDPESSDYLFHKDSAAAKGKTTRAQDASMGATGASAADTISSQRDRDLSPAASGGPAGLAATSSDPHDAGSAGNATTTGQTNDRSGSDLSGLPPENSRGSATGVGGASSGVGGTASTVAGSTTGITGATSTTGVGGSATTGVSGTSVPGLSGSTTGSGSAGGTASGKRPSTGTRPVSDQDQDEELSDGSEADDIGP